MKRAALLGWAALAAWCAQVGTSPAPPRLPPEVQAIAGLAYASPPELAADAFLRLIAAGKVQDREAKLELIEQAFTFAAGAREPFRLRHVGDAPADSRSGMRDRAARLKLDGLSLRTRAVRALLDLDPAKAREMFGRIEPPQPAARTCEDALIADPGDFYALAAEIEARTFSAGERKLEQHISFVRPFLLSIASPVQVAPAARLARMASATARQRDLLVASFIAGLDNVAADSRSFAPTLHAAHAEVEQLAEVCRRQGIAADGLKQAFEKYIERQRGGTQCASEEGAIDVGFALGVTSKPVAPPRIHRYWSSPESQAMLARGMKLRWGPTGTPGRMLTLEERRTAEWQAQLAETLNELASWKPAPEESETDYFHERCLIYETLVELTPPGATRDNVVAAFAAFLAGSPVRRESPAEWLSHAAEILSRLRLSGDSDAGRVAEAFLRSGEPALALAVRLELVAPRSPLMVEQ